MRGGKSRRGRSSTTKIVRTAVWDTARRKSLRRRRQRASTQLSERQGTQTPSLAPRLPHPGSNRRWSSRKLSYSYMNESRGQVSPKPDWSLIPAMMRMTVSTPSVLGMLKGFTRPFNFVHVPLLFPSLYPAGKDSSNFSLIMPFSKHRDAWLNTQATDTHSGKRHSICLLDPNGRAKKVEVKCYGNILGAYREHPEAKFLGRDGSPCHSLTRGLLSRSHIVANRHRYVGKETSRRWEQGDDPSMVDFRCAEYGDGKMVADEQTRERIKQIGVRKVARETKINRETVTLIAKGSSVKANTLRKVVGFFSKIA